MQVQLNGQRTEQQQLELREGDILGVGRRHWLRIQRRRAPHAANHS